MASSLGFRKRVLHVTRTEHSARLCLWPLAPRVESIHPRFRREQVGRRDVSVASMQGPPRQECKLLQRSAIWSIL